MRRRLAIVLASVLLQGSLLAQPGDMTAAVVQLRTALAQTLNHQDLEGSVALYEPDAVFLSPEGRFPDRAAIRTLYRSVFQAYRGQIVMTSRRLVGSGTVCVDDGSYSETITNLSTSKRLAITGNYVLVARRQTDGGWKVAELVWTQTSSQQAP